MKHKTIVKELGDIQLQLKRLIAQIDSDIPTDEQKAQEHQQKFCRVSDELYTIIREYIPSDTPVNVFYSAYKTDADGTPINNLYEIALTGKVRLFSEANQLAWGKGTEYKSLVLLYPNWLKLCSLANEAIDTTGDYHHIFFEAVRLRTDQPEEGVTHYEFSMGS